jgi:hypothetical protein
MTHFSECHECHLEFEEAELTRCFNCDDTHCAECTEILGADERTCGCEPLCATDRQEPTKCKTCEADGCILCMGNGCEICQQIEVFDKRFELVCDSCRVDCAVCNEPTCFEHLDRVHTVNKKTGKRKRKAVCLDCLDEALEDLTKKRKAPLHVASSIAVNPAHV